MSAYMVDKEHIDVLVSLAVSGPSGTTGPGNAWHRLGWFDGAIYHRVGDGFTEDETGAMLIAASLDSIHARYPDTITDPHNVPGPLHTYWEVPYGWTDPRVRLTPVEGLAALGCYEYQSCEHEGWSTSEAYAFVQSLRAALVHRLPGMDDAPYHWTDSVIASRRGVRLA